MNPEKIKKFIETSRATGVADDKIVSYLKNKGIDLSTGEVVVKQPEEKKSILSKVSNALISSEKAFGEDIAAAATNVLPKSWTGVKQLEEASQTYTDNLLNISKVIKNKREKGDTAGAEKWKSIFQEEVRKSPPELSDLYPALKKTNWQVVGDAAGVLADILSVGSYGKVVGTTGKLTVKGGGLLSYIAPKLGIPVAEKVVTKVAETGIKKTLLETSKVIGRQTVERAIVGGGVGYGYDVIGNVKEGKTGIEAVKPGIGTITGIAVPLVIGGIRETAAITKDMAPRLVNSLVKPSKANFAYGKDPGRTVAELGITGNNMDDLANNINKERKNIGSQIGAIYDNPANAGIKINLTDDIAKIDDAITEAVKGGKNNQTIVDQLQAIKDSLLYSQVQNAEGKIANTGAAKDLTSLTAKEAFNLKDAVANGTRFNGTPTDDKKVNSILKNIYGGIKEKLNSALGVNNPEIQKLNQQYADLTSAELATINRASIVERANVISMPIKVGGATAIITAISTGGAAVPVILAGATAGALDKALGSTAVKTRVAAWFAKESPNVIQAFLQNNPELAPVLRRTFPALTSKLSKN